MTNSIELEPLREWFRIWGRHVSAVDMDAARPLFSAEVVGFGTHATFVKGLDALHRDQWSKIWPNITDFRFEVEHLVGDIGSEHAWAAVPWSSTGYHEDGSAFDRPGRATVTFRKVGGNWLGTHTHFSLAPGVAPHTHGRAAG